MVNEPIRICSDDKRRHDGTRDRRFWDLACLQTSGSQIHSLLLRIHFMLFLQGKSNRGMETDKNKSYVTRKKYNKSDFQVICSLMHKAVTWIFSYNNFIISVQLVIRN
jgi:hypothetical protein